jgi:small subunit ribosomal protein S20
MPIIKSAIKKMRQDKKRTARNLITKDRFKAAVRAFKKNPTEKNLAIAYRFLDRAAKKNVIHRNKAARLKSRMAKLLKKGAPAETKKPAAKKKASVRKAATKKTSK